MRYFAELSYQGTHYFGWQKQPGQISVQATLEQAFSTILRTPVAMTGCGRTDTGVHARQYFAHFDSDNVLLPALERRLNQYLPRDIAIHRIIPVHPEAHARFDAFQRSYEYHLSFRKIPFEQETCYWYGHTALPDRDRVQAAAALLMNYREFFPFCKSEASAKTMHCDLTRAEWVFDDDAGRWVLHLTANRFLRGMVRLIVGMCLNVGLGKSSLDEVRYALDTQTLLKKSQSAPPQGLFLTEVLYPYSL
ncbi:MAG: tRNA pseudouridine synthase A [Saprospiraceae bacterium]|nr:tRNA pseudouridine synthase A [Saprospiraceae bacterium]